jgi:hypothetical protein
MFEFAGNHADFSIAVVPPRQTLLGGTTAAVSLNQQERYYRPEVPGHYRLAGTACSNVYFTKR